MDELFRYVDEGFEASVERLSQFLRMPSVGTDPAFDPETRRCAEWLASELAGIGFEASVRDTPGQPIVVGHWPNPAADGPHLLYYGHYDVQPADPLELWESPPFEPRIMEGPKGRQIVARGAVDDKGQVMTWLEAFRAYKAVRGNLPFPITVLVEGEEESSSANLEPFLQANAKELASDVCIISDTGMLDVDRPAITTMLRGIVYIEVTLSGPSHDLHSGMYGGAVVNPLNVLSGLLAGLHDADGRVTLPGFYDAVLELTPEQTAEWNSLGFDDATFLGTAGLDRSVGEAGRTLLERIWSRPTLDVNGVWGGYTGKGAKTVIPAHASAKLSCRLVPDQRSDAVLDSLKRYFAENCPPGCLIKVTDLGKGDPIRVPAESRFIEAARQATTHAFPRPAALIGSGGSIPVAASIRETLGIDSVLLGFGLDDDRVHSPNEKFTLVCLERGIKTHLALLNELAKE
ncbi:MAG: dipeptidase [Candidatus Eisenbacteria bacterium]